MKPTIADFLIKNFDEENYATKSILKEKMKSMKYKFRNLNNVELEKTAIKRLKRNLWKRNRIAKIKADPGKKEIFRLKESVFRKTQYEKIKDNPTKLEKRRKYNKKWQLNFNKTEIGREKSKAVNQKYRLKKKAKLFLFFSYLIKILTKLKV